MTSEPPKQNRSEEEPPQWLFDDLPDYDAPPSWADTSSAVAEEKNWNDLDTIRVANDGRWLRLYGWTIVGFTVTFALVFLASLIAWSSHYILPKAWLWLGDDQLSKIQSVLFSGGMGAIISAMVKRQLDRVKS